MKNKSLELYYEHEIFNSDGEKIDVNYIFQIAGNVKSMCKYIKCIPIDDRHEYIVRPLEDWDYETSYIRSDEFLEENDRKGN